ncbi:hypothetical protein [Candidatus Odyssella thessalonicensis]|uniref:hypothetical protein n=1 Tax=Candidatus Odyssella thessalonicensis TaxID=84647 RepID=UPI000225B700|nr:hypothetical protein [Candidatus Odyssella thessalonicensis]
MNFIYKLNKYIRLWLLLIINCAVSMEINDQERALDSATNSIDFEITCSNRAREVMHERNLSLIVWESSPQNCREKIIGCLQMLAHNPVQSSFALQQAYPLVKEQTALVVICHLLKTPPVSSSPVTEEKALNWVRVHTAYLQDHTILVYRRCDQSRKGQVLHKLNLGVDISNSGRFIIRPQGRYKSLNLFNDLPLLNEVKESSLPIFILGAHFSTLNSATASQHHLYQSSLIIKEYLSEAFSIYPEDFRRPARQFKHLLAEFLIHAQVVDYSRLNEIQSVIRQELLSYRQINKWEAREIIEAEAL